MPRRPDFHDLIEETGRAEGRLGGQNSWVIDTLEPGDVLVVDMFGKIRTENGRRAADARL